MKKMIFVLDNLEMMTGESQMESQMIETEDLVDVAKIDPDPLTWANKMRSRAYLIRWKIRWNR